MNDSIQTRPDWCQNTDLDNFVLLLEGLKGSLAQDLREPLAAEGAGDAASR